MTRPACTVTCMAQVSGQSCGQAARTSVLAAWEAAPEEEACAEAPDRLGFIGRNVPQRGPGATHRGAGA
jgi:hypothetical protein